MLVLTDPPRHTQIRRSIARLFTPRAVRSLEGLARRTVASLLEGMLRKGGGDFVTDVAAPLPLAVSAELLGVGHDDIPLIVEASARAAEGATHEAGNSAEAGHHDVMMYYFRILQERRRTPSDDLVTALLDARIDGLGLTDEEIILTCDNVVVAASETARHAASGGLYALLEQPEAWRALRAGQVDTGRAAEEVLRWTAPATHIMRTAVADTELAGVRIGAGDVLAVWTTSANRDEAVFPDAHRLLLDRHPNPHLTFGAGAHFCIGAAIVRIILRVLLEELAARFDQVALAGPVRHNGSWAGSGLVSLPLTTDSAGGHRRARPARPAAREPRSADEARPAAAPRGCPWTSSGPGAEA